MKKQLILIIFLLSAICIISSFINYVQFQTNRNLIRTNRIISVVQTKNTKEICILKKEICDYKINAPRIIALTPLNGLVTDDDIDHLINEIPQGNPFLIDFQVTSSFGESTGFKPRKKHKGIDIIPTIPGKEHWGIYAFAPGEVITFGLDKTHGKYIVIEHSERVRTKYSHLDKIYYSATTGKKVATDTKIGIMGDTGYSTRPHLHFEIQILVNDDKWIRINPRPYLIKEKEKIMSEKKTESFRVINDNPENPNVKKVPEKTIPPTPELPKQTERRKNNET